MNKATLTKEVANATDLTQKEAKLVIDTFMKVVRDTLATGEVVKIQKFGTFSTYERKERNGVNPQTREKMVIPAKTVAKFKASDDLSEMVNV
jgi:DNA-binding protein HU-beta